MIAVDRIAGELLGSLERVGAYRLKGRELDLVRKPCCRKIADLGVEGGEQGLVGKMRRFFSSGGNLRPKAPAFLLRRWTKVTFPVDGDDDAVIGVCAVRDVDAAIDFAKEVEGQNRHTAAMYSHVSPSSREWPGHRLRIFVRTAPHSMVWEKREGYTSYTIASPTGEE